MSNQENHMIGVGTHITRPMCTKFVQACPPHDKRLTSQPRVEHVITFSTSRIAFTVLYEMVTLNWFLQLRAEYNKNQVISIIPSEQINSAFISIVATTSYTNC